MSPGQSQKNEQKFTVRSDNLDFILLYYYLLKRYIYDISRQFKYLSLPNLKNALIYYCSSRFRISSFFSSKPGHHGLPVWARLRNYAFQSRGRQDRDFGTPVPMSGTGTENLDRFEIWVGLGQASLLPDTKNRLFATTI